LIDPCPMKNVYLLSLGCPRNLVDSEVLLGILEEKGFSIVDEPEGADVAVVNTCGFIQDAKQESIDAILQLAELKKNSLIKKLVVAGCLSQRYPDELMAEIGEIDGIFGTSSFTDIPGLLDALLSGEKIKDVKPVPDFLYSHTDRRKILTPAHYAYVKIQEGCSNRCSYCVIPELKGPRRSREIGSILDEIERLKEEHDLKELIFVGQDTTSFGIERSGKPELAELLRAASPLMEGGWIRLLYTHPAHFTDELIDVIAGTENICKYIDLPIQHINDRILRKMNRRVLKGGITGLIERIRGKIGDVTLRTSVIVGFPTETDGEFAELVGFLEDIRFERLGAFIYSREEGTPAAGFKEQVPEDVKRSRFDRVMKLQQKISAGNNLRYLARTAQVLIDEKDPSSPGTYLGRSCMDAPEVDGTIYVKGAGLEVGQFVDVRITGTMEYDLMGEAI
jgi:ribosomal protein S12 methylthiotransferase